VTYPNWQHRLLEAMGLPPTAARISFLTAWAMCEGGTAKWNPLNTTLKLPGSTKYNDAGVQHYADDLQGVAATLLTIRLPYYRDIRRALLTQQTASAIARSSTRGLQTWGTGSKCIEAVLAGH